MDDRYTPDAPASANCPHCTYEISGAPATGKTIIMAMLYCRCPGCGEKWDEWRTYAGVTRYWEPAPLAVP